MKFKVGDIVKTKDGRDARIICTDWKTPDGHSIIALANYKDMGTEELIGENQLVPQAPKTKKVKMYAYLTPAYNNNSLLLLCYYNSECVAGLTRVPSEDKEIEVECEE